MTRAAGAARTIVTAVLLLMACAPAQNGSPNGSNAVVAADSHIVMERLPCYGTCPVYRVTVDADGVITFEGERHVVATGTRSARIGAAAAAALMRELEAAGFFQLESQYVHEARACGLYHTDAPRVNLTLVLDGRTKTVEHDYGCGGAPALLRTLQDRVDEVAGVDRWVGGAR